MAEKEKVKVAPKKAAKKTLKGSKKLGETKLMVTQGPLQVRAWVLPPGRERPALAPSSGLLCYRIVPRAITR